ncbi:MAG: glucosamine-6-phosphate deaminase [Planctomycetes bacterium]|nr:glucosamine-6-phosphate deaminase [Planctomycetota bacterium]
MEIVIRTDYGAISDEAFRIVEGEVARRPALVVGLATGRTPLGLYERWAASKRSFKRARFFNLDEFVGLGPEHAGSFHRTLRERLLAPLRVPPRNVFLLRGDVKDPDKAAAAYEKVLRAAGGIDLQILGVGRNGHIGFNEPGSSLGSRTRTKTLTDETRAAHAEAFGSMDRVPRFAITMGIGTILEARYVVLLASGEEKAQVVRRMIEGPVTAEVPGSALQLHPRATAVLDEAAASALARRDYWKWVAENKWRVGQ